MPTLLKRFAVAAVLTGFSAHTALAGFSILGASVTHTSLVQFGSPTSETAFSASGPIDSFDTTDIHNNGAVMSAQPTAISLLTRYGAVINAQGSAEGFYNNGALGFSSDAPVSLAPTFIGASRLPASFKLSVTDNLSGLAWNWGPTPTNSIPHVYGDLASPLPAGAYTLRWDQSPSFSMASFVLASFKIDMITVPEPHALGMFAVATLLRRRR